MRDVTCDCKSTCNLQFDIRVLPSCSQKEKQDVDDLELPDTRALFLESGIDLEDKRAKEMQEYLDAVNKEVIERSELNGVLILSATVTVMAAAAAWVWAAREALQ